MHHFWQHIFPCFWFLELQNDLAHDTASFILNFEQLLNQISKEETKNAYDERRAFDIKKPSLVEHIEY